MAFSDILKEVMALSDAAAAYWAEELPKRHPNYPIVRPGEDDGPPPEAEKQLERLLRSLPAETIYKLALIMYLGRGTLKADDLVRGYQEIKDRFEQPEMATKRMLDTPPLAEDLAEGLEKLKRNHIDVNTLLESVTS